MNILQAEQDRGPQRIKHSHVTIVASSLRPSSWSRFLLLKGWEHNHRYQLTRLHPLYLSLPHLTHGSGFPVPSLNPHCFGDLAHNISDTICFSLRGAVKHTQRSPLTSPGSWGPTVLWLAYSGFTGSSFEAQKSDPNRGHHLDLSWKLFSACTGFLGSFLDLACTFPGPRSLPLLPFCTRVTAGLVPEMRMMHALHTKALTSGAAGACL